MSAHRAKKHFGQHFLHDQGVIERILRALNPQPGETLVEIGPGLGALTVPLVARVPALTVVELDRDVLAPLRAACGAHAERLTVIQADALTVDFAALAPAGGKLRLVGNLPYNISTPLLFHLLRHADAIQDMHFMLQKEVVDRMCAAPDSDDYGRLTVTLAARADCHSLFRVGPGSFDPPPKVDSAVVRVLPRPAPFPLDDLARYDRVVTAAFSQRRKTLSNALKAVMPAEAIRAAGIDPGLRAEALPPEAFGRLAQQI
ncbi:MAG: 16S rRNA (adenine(1518)-N(6)/adenine(1519)-N(6))-dimethyltransferase RsmA [Stagnimonas sp.]|nr:16S rRNA (adenine(1518)-N(6)/adenine(1519)-N(6))-dimethyltransferase RsmA [Stagnimonas sp.]